MLLLLDLMLSSGIQDEEEEKDGMAACHHDIYACCGREPDDHPAKMRGMRHCNDCRHHACQSCAVLYTIMTIGSAQVNDQQTMRMMLFFPSIFPCRPRGKPKLNVGAAPPHLQTFQDNFFFPSAQNGRARPLVVKVPIVIVARVDRR